MILYFVPAKKEWFYEVGNEEVDDATTFLESNKVF